ncbi:hypothetical protein LXA43DRAFT_1090979 [Ganoderma leucocontextum]|nr:hypothetical protein LXA43DRAFT_1090979 [Ganoderma leucocontextum]
MSSDSPISFLIHDISKPIVRISDHEFTTATITQECQTMVDASVFAMELIKAAKPHIIRHPIIGVTIPADYIRYALCLGFAAVSCLPPSAWPPPALATPSSSTVREDTSRTPTSTRLDASQERQETQTRVDLTGLDPPFSYAHTPTSPSSHAYPGPCTPAYTGPAQPHAHGLTSACPSPPSPSPSPSRLPSPPSAAAFNKVLGTLASLRREALKLIQQRPLRASPASASGPSSYFCRPRWTRSVVSCPGPPRSLLGSPH